MSTDAPPAPPDRLRHPVAAFEATGRRFLPGVAFPIAVWAVWRVAHLVVLALLDGHLVRTAYNYDGERYTLIMQQGYALHDVDMPNTAFFPMVSWVATPIYWVTRSTDITIHLVASATAIAAFIGVWGVTKLWRNEYVARRAVLLLALFPSSLFLWAFYSEGLFIALGTGVVWADRRGRRGLAAALCVPLAATRSVGILIPAVMVLVHVIENGPRLSEEWRRWWGPAVASCVAISLVGFSVSVQTRWLVPGVVALGVWALARRRLDPWCFAYLGAALAGLVAVTVVMGAQTGDPLAWLKVQDDWGRGLDQPWSAVIQGFDNLYPDADTIMVPALVARNLDIWSVAIVAFPIGYAALSRHDRFPVETWLLGVALIALPLYSSVLASFNRFALADWVIYPVYASLLVRVPRRWRAVPWLALAAGSALATWQMVERFAADRFIG